MANASVKTVTKEVVEEKEENFYVLTLSEDEALMIRAVAGNVAGGSKSWAKHSSAVYYALSKAMGTAYPVFDASKFVRLSPSTLAHLLPL